VPEDKWTPTVQNFINETEKLISPPEKQTIDKKEPPQVSKKDEAIKYYEQGANKYNQGLYNEAKQNFEKAVELDPENTKAWYGLAKSYYNLNDLESAKSICNYLINNLKVTGEDKERTDKLLAKIGEKESSI